MISRVSYILRRMASRGPAVRAADRAEESSLVVSYLTLRKAVGVIGISLPWVLSLGCLALSGIDLKPSISEYYDTVMRDVFVGLLFAVALFLFSYKGYENDQLAGRFAALLAVGVALFPTSSPTRWVHFTHLGCATILFLTLAYFSLFLFTKTDPGRTQTAGKRKRNVVYRVCGIAIVGSVVLAAVCMETSLGRDLAQLRPVFWLESLALESFGLSWMTKGEALWKD